MSTSDIMAIRGLLPDSEPDDFFVSPRQEQRKLYRFKDDDDRDAATADLIGVADQLREKHGRDEVAANEEFQEIVFASDRFWAVIIHDCLDECEAKLARQKRRKGRSKR